MEPLTFNSPDTHGFTPDPSLIGAVLQHSGNQEQYVVIGFTWLGATDEWGFIAQRLDVSTFNATVTRPLSHLCGQRANGLPRYYEGDDYKQYSV